MAVYHGYDAVLEIAGVDISDRVTALEIMESYDTIDTEAFGDSHKKPIAGLGSFTLTATFQQDQSASETYATIQGRVGQVTTFMAKYSSDTASSTNRRFTGSVLVTEFSHVNAEIGSLDTFSVTWPGYGALAVATT
jgi:D-lyxose ketol-isomerase